MSARVLVLKTRSCATESFLHLPHGNVVIGKIAYARMGPQHTRCEFVRGVGVCCTVGRSVRERTSSASHPVFPRLTEDDRNVATGTQAIETYVANGPVIIITSIRLALLVYNYIIPHSTFLCRVLLKSDPLRASRRCTH